MSVGNEFGDEFNAASTYIGTQALTNLKLKGPLFWPALIKLNGVHVTLHWDLTGSEQTRRANNNKW